MFASNGDLTLEFPNQLEPDLLCSLQCVLDIEEFLNLTDVSEKLWAASNTDIGRVSIEPTKVQAGIPNLSLNCLNIH